MTQGFDHALRSPVREQVEMRLRSRKEGKCPVVMIWSDRTAQTRGTGDESSDGRGHHQQNANWSLDRIA